MGEWGNNGWNNFNKLVFAKYLRRLQPTMERD
jgi:hypothetical protein